MTKLTRSDAWRALAEHATRLTGKHLRDLFADDPERFERFSLRLDDLLVDFSKQRVSAETLRLLVALARSEELEAKRDRMFAGEAINSTERRAVLHIALRNRSERPIPTADAAGTRRDVMPEVRAVLDRMRQFVGAVRDRRTLGHTGRPFRDVVHLGIGGSDLGPYMVCEALAPYRSPELRPHFVSNVDGAHLADALRDLDPARTLFVVASKTFTTQETMANAASARAWLVDALGDPGCVANHFVALSTNDTNVRAFGITRERTFEFWDWVGGRYSLWSAIGLSIALSIGFERFEELLTGAHAIDEHFRTTPLEHNIPVMLGLIGVWNRNFLGARTHAVLPYDQHLHRFPAYLQQADMESNGKAVRRDGDRVDYDTGPIVFGEPGTNGQHAFYQLLHQGTECVPADFIAAAKSHHDMGEHHLLLLANFLAQPEALAFGKTETEVRRELEASGASPAEIEDLAPHKTFAGNRPSTSILYEKLTPHALGRLIALYEHQIFVQGAIWGINSFDQWGVELGKQLALQILPELRTGDESGPRDGSTRAQLRFLRELRGRA